MEDSIEQFKNIIKLINESYPDSAFHRKVKRRADNIVSELGKKNRNGKKLAILLWAFERLGVKRN
jgi:outer membrane protein assembly factor BamD (BamD/ComL family)